MHQRMPVRAATAGVLLIMLLAYGVVAQRCGVTPTFQFKRVANSAGQPSYITSSGETVAFTKDVRLPPVIVQLSTGTDTFDFSLDGRLVVVSLTPALRVGGYSVELNKGEAIFDALTIQELPGGVPSKMAFSVQSADGLTTYSISTGDLVHVATSEHTTPSRVVFRNSGYFTRADIGREVPVSPAAVPNFGLQVLNRIGYPIVVTQPIVTVSGSDCTVAPTTYSTLSIDGLKVTKTGNNPTLSFEVSLNAGAFKASVATGGLQLITTTQRNKFMLFDADKSFIRLENQGNTAVLSVPMPNIVINLYTGAMEFDASNTGLIITASTPQGTLSGAEALVVRGVATFSELTFIGQAPRSAVITFTAGTQSALPVAGATLLSGAMAVTSTAIKSKHLSFNFASLVNAKVPLAIPTGTGGAFTVPPVTVSVLDSAYGFDPTAMDFNLRITVDPADAVAGGATFDTAPVTSGTAVFKGLNFSSSSKPFSLIVSDIAAATAGGVALRTSVTSKLVTPLPRTITSVATASSALAACDLATSTTCVLSIAFASEFGTFSSHVYAEDQQIFTSVGSSIPAIFVELHDQFGVAATFPSTVAPTLVAYTADDPNAETLLVTEGGANRGAWQNGRYRFSCLQFRTAPTGLVRIQFMPIDESRSPSIRLQAMFADGSPLRTGFVSVTAVPVPNYGLRFSPSLSSIAYPGQRASAVLNVALPSVAIELVNSLGNFDNTDSSVLIVASTSSGTLDPAGTTQRVSRGRASFSSLVFRTPADDPEITFTAFGTNIPVAGKTLIFGPLLMSALPIPAFQLLFSPVVSPNNNITYGFKEMSFGGNGTAAAVVASVIVADSAYQQSRGDEIAAVGPVIVTVSSDEATLGGATQVTVDTAGPCGCANFSNTLTAYKPGIAGGTGIYLRYVVTSATGLLRGRTLVAGPIYANGLTSTTTSASCSVNVVAKKVIGEFRMKSSVFLARNVSQGLASLLGILPARIVVVALKDIARVDPKTLEPWKDGGTKVTFTFREPFETSSNRKSSTELANEFVTLRPGCDATEFELAAVYAESSDKSCDEAAFEVSLQASKDCVNAGGNDCQCYDKGVVAEWGQICAEEAQLRDTLVSMCNRLTNCQEAEIQNVCDTLLPPQAVNLVFLWGTLGAIGGVVLMVGVANYKDLLRRKRKIALGKHDS